jgi:subtilisin family serine protease
MNLYRKFQVTGIALALSCAVQVAHAESQAALHQPTIAKELLEESQSSYIFVLKKTDATANVVRDNAHRLSAQHGGKVSHVFTSALHGFSANMSAKAAEKLAANGLVAYYEKDGIAWVSKPPADKPGGGKGGNGGGDETPDPQVVPYGVARVGGPVDGTGYHAWVIDTGIDAGHADLNVGTGDNFVSRGKDTTKDGNGHGTHVAGTIGAIFNDIDVVGVAQNATVHPVRVLDNNGSGLISWVVAGVDYVAANANAGDVANMSLGAQGTFQSLEDAIIAAADKGIKFSLAAGNDSDDASGYSPAKVEHANVYTVSAVDSNDVFASFSNYGNPPIDFAAPGVSVLSTKKGGGTVAYSGTSMAAPHVAGILLVAEPQASGEASGDPDGNADPIAHLPLQ